MTSLQNLRAPADESFYTSWTDLRKALNDWAIQAKFIFRTPKKDPTHATYRCRNEACGWRCSAYKNSDGLLLLRVKERSHTCTATSAHGAASSKEWLDEVVSSHIQVNRGTKPAELIELVSVHYNEKISYKVAQLCRLRLLTGGIGHQRYSFQLLPAYRDAVELQAPGATMDLSIDPATGNFFRCFVCPAQSRATFVSCRRLVAVKGTALLGRLVQTLLTAVGIDAAGQNVVLAWGFVESENRSSWEYFLRQLRRAIPDISSEECTLISQRDNGLLEAEKVLGPRIVPSYCCQYLEEVFTGKFGKTLSTLFWKAAKARNIQDFEHWMSQIGVIKAAAQSYLRELVGPRFLFSHDTADLSSQNPVYWANAHFPGQRFGCLTIKVSESVNLMLNCDRELAVTELLDAIWHRVMAQRTAHSANAIKQAGEGVLYTAGCTPEIEESRKWARYSTVELLSPWTWRAIQTNGAIHTVDLRASDCTCGRYRCNKIPCAHAMRCIFEQGQSLEDFLPQALSIERWRLNYINPMPHIVIDGLQPLDTEECNPPHTSLPRGRPRKPRTDKAAQKVAQGLSREDLEPVVAVESSVLLF